MIDNFAYQFTKLNVTGRVFCTCRTHDVKEPRRIAIYTRAIEDAVYAAIRERQPNGEDSERILTEQLTLLTVAVAKSAATQSVVTAGRCQRLPAHKPCTKPTRRGKTLWARHRHPHGVSLPLAPRRYPKAWGKSCRKSVSRCRNC